MFRFFYGGGFFLLIIYEATLSRVLTFGQKQIQRETRNRKQAGKGIG